jgi:hypothetical protein
MHMPHVQLGRLLSESCACLLHACRFDTVYVDGKIRIAQDIRGDTLIVENNGPPRMLT